MAETINNGDGGRERLKPVINRDRLVSTKKPLGKRISDTFLTEDTADIKNYIIRDVIIPGIKNVILDFISMLFFGETCFDGRRNSRRIDRHERIDYRSHYRINSGRRSRDYDDNDYYDSDNKVDFRNIIVRDREDAEIIVSNMRSRIRDEGAASIANLLDYIDVVGRYTDNNWGWDNERDIGIRRVASGYLIDVAEPKYLT